ncbi:NADPH-dependent diflavin oxidoreductase 1 [Chytriomyces hyalinus]|nr:NADPH-dependent diflavin oxidoreductase 1 [Chytriomyces hyalinus]
MVAVTLAYASETGTAIECAQSIAREARRRCCATTVNSCDEMDRARLAGMDADSGNKDMNHDDAGAMSRSQKDDVFVFCIATAGQGDPPRNMRRFWRWIMRADTPQNALLGRRFAVFGLGDSSYKKFNYPAKKLYKRMIQLGAIPIIPRGDGDDQHPLGLDAEFDPWCLKLWAAIDELSPPPKGLNITPKNVLPPPSFKVQFLEDSTGIAATVPQPSTFLRAKCVQNSRITSIEHFQDVRHVNFDIASLNVPTIVTYNPADVMTMHPRNSAESVQELLEFMEWTGMADTPFKLTSTTPDLPVPAHWAPIPTLRSVLHQHLDISGRPRRYFFHLLSFFATDIMHAEKLQEFASMEGQEELFAYCYKLRRTTLEVLTDFHSCKGKIPYNYLFDLIPPLRARMYSIASAQTRDANGAFSGNLELCVGLLKYKTRMQKMREGVCSKFLEDLKVGETVDFIIEPGTMQLPKSIDTPVILIGAGTGIAPMRSLLQARIHQGATANVMFTGFRGREADYLYGAEFEAMQEQGKLRLFNAFSRDNPNKVWYIQHRMAVQSQLIWDILSSGGYLYVSGNAQRIPKSVNDALMDIFMKNGSMTEDEAAAFLAKLEKLRRLPIEVIQAILLHADIDKDLLQFSHVCRKVAAAVRDSTHAFHHIRQRFQLSREGVQCDMLGEMVFSRDMDAADKTTWTHQTVQLHKLRDQLQEPDQLPFAYKVALFVLASQVDELSFVHFSADTTLRVVQSMDDSAHPINWGHAVIFLAKANNIPALDYVISNHLPNVSNMAIETAIEATAAHGHTEALLLLLACPRIDPEPISLNGALMRAVNTSQLHCVDILLNDPQQRVTCEGLESTLEQSVENKNLPISALLIQHGVVFNCLTSLLSRALSALLLWEQPGVDRNYLDNVLLLESVLYSDCSASRQLLDEERVRITTDDYEPVRMALEWWRTNHVLLFLEVAEQKSDMEPFRIVQAFLDQNETPADFRGPLLERIEAIMVS